MITIKQSPDYFLTQKNIKKIELPYKRDKSLHHYLKEINLENQRIVVLGKKIEDLNYVPDNGDEIIITPDLKWPLLVAAAKVVWAFVIAHPFLTMAAIAMTTYSIYTYLNQPRIPSFNANAQGLDEGSPTYDWEGGRTIQEIGTPIPIAYGRHKLWGNIINQYLRTDGDKNYLHVLIALCEGPIKGISNIKINDNPIENYSDITYDYRLGTNDQSVIPNFEDLHDVNNMNIKLNKDSPYIYMTIRNDIEAFELYLSFPGGLFQQTDGGGMGSWDVSYKVEYKLHNGGNYINLGEFTISAKNRSNFKRIFRKNGLSAGQYDIRITKISSDSDLIHIGDMYLSAVDEIRTDDLAYPNTALLAIEALAADQLSGATPNFSCIAEAKLIRIPKIMYGETEVDWEDYYWDKDTEQYKRFSDNEVCSWDGETYVERFSANPIWCFRDLKLNARYGLGEFIKDIHIDDDLYLEISRVCEEKVLDGNGGYEKRFRLDVVIDSLTDPLDLLMQLGSVFRAIIFYSEGVVKTRIEKPDEITQIFGMGNIIKDSFQQSWKSIKDNPNVVEVQFLDKDKDYEQETIAVIDEQALAAGDPLRVKTIRLFLTGLSYAIREGRFALKVAKYLNRTISIKVGIGAVACQAGDLIGISHDVPQWGFSGRVKPESTTTKIKLDRSVTIEEGTYHIIVFFSDDKIEERTILNEPGEYTEVDVTETFTQEPANYDVYSVGKVNKVVKPFRVLGMQMDNRNEILISAIEYNENIFDDSAIVIPETNYSVLDLNIPNIENLELNERIVKLKDGTIENVIDVFFTKPNMTSYRIKQYDRAAIYISDNNGASWEFKGETKETSFNIMGGIEELRTYRVAVVSVTKDGDQNTIADSPQDSIYILGKILSPANVTGFEVYQEGSMLRFSCDPSADVDFAYFRVKKGSEWNTGQVITERADLTEFMYPVGEIGKVIFMSKTVDTSGNESDAPAIDIITVTPPPDMNFVEDFDLWIRSLEYKLSDDLGCEYRNLYNANYVRKVIALKTAKSWEELELEGKTWEQAEADGDLILDKEFVTSEEIFELAQPIDLEIIFEFKVIIDVSYKNVQDGNLIVQISISEDGINYSSWADVNANILYRARYVNYRFKLQTSDANYNIWFYGCRIYMNAPVARLAYFRDVAIPVEGKTVIFGVDFSYPPRVVVTIVNGIVGVPIVNNKTKDGCLIKVYDLAGNAIGTSEIDCDVKGY